MDESAPTVIDLAIAELVAIRSRHLSAVQKLQGLVENINLRLADLDKSNTTAAGEPKIESATTPTCGNTGEEKVGVLIENWCSDPEMWATHGYPPDQKMARLKRDVVAMLEKRDD